MSIYIKKRERKSNISTLCDLCFMMSKVCALGEIVKTAVSPVHISPCGQKNCSLKTSALICSHSSLELGE